ncbi:MAG: N-acetylmuramoyl-L-alanine amidase [Paraprevotella sp.]|nr:N-acetylmuramoyl-L-alanine amidase [Paraprevotella sp.]
MKRIRSIKIIAMFFLALTGSIYASYAAVPGSKSKFTLVIDAGHGGKDPGAIGHFSREKNINLAVAKAFGELVEKNCPDVKVIYTRKTDVFIPLGQRAEIANRAGANLFISIHTNSLPNKVVGRGTETYTLGMARAEENLEVAKRENSVILVENDYKERYQNFDPKSSESYIIFEFMQDKYMAQSVDFAQQLQREFRTTGGRPDKGIHQAGFLVLRETSMPSVLIELGYISTHDEESFLNSQNGIRVMSLSIYNAFLKYKKQHTKGDPSAQPAEKETVVSKEQTTVSTTDNAETSEIDMLTQTNDTPTDTTPASPKPETPPVVSKEKGRPVFKIQLLASVRQIPSGRTRFKGLTPVEFYKEDEYYKYTYGETTDYKEAVKMRNKVKENFAGAFIIAFKNGTKMNLQQAISEYKKNK